MISDKYRVENCGDNSGVMVANNSGSIYFTMQKAIRIPSLISNVVKVLGNVCIDEEYSASGVNIQKNLNLTIKLNIMVLWFIKTL